MAASDYIQLAVGTGVTVMKQEGKKLRRKDTNDTGRDDAGGRALEAMAAGIETIDFSDLQSAKSLKNIGAAFIAVGEKLQEEAERIESGK